VAEQPIIKARGGIIVGVWGKRVRRPQDPEGERTDRMRGDPRGRPTLTEGTGFTARR